MNRNVFVNAVFENPGSNLFVDFKKVDFYQNYRVSKKMYTDLVDSSAVNLASINFV